MTHDEAIKDGATERYVLDEMTDEERDAFEEHYFDCAVCAEDVRAAIAIRDGLATVEREEDRPVVVPLEPRRRTLPASLAAAAAALILGVLTMQFTLVSPLRTQLAQSRQPYVPLDYPLRAVRGIGPHINSTAAASLNVELPPGIAATQNAYTCRILDAQGHLHGSPVKVAPQQIVDGTLTVVIPPGALSPGNYSLRVDDINPPVEPYPFTIEPVSDTVR